MAVLCGMPTIQYSARSVRLSVHKVFTSCIRRGLVSPDSIVNGCLRLTDVSVIWCVVNPRRTSQKIWGGILYRVYRPGNDLELIPTAKMETRNHVEVILVVSYGGLKSIFEKFLRFFGKTTPYAKIFKIVPKVYIATPIDVVVFKFREIWPTGNRPLFTKQKKNFACLSNCRYCVDRA